MSDNKMLQMLLDGQSSIKKQMKGGFNEVNEKIDENTKRIDILGLQLAELSDDAPTMEDFEVFEQRVEKLEHQIITA